MNGTHIDSIENLKSFRPVDDSHGRVVNFYAERNAEMEKNVRFIRGKIYTPEELKLYQETKRVPIVLNKLLAPFRTIMGTFLSAMFDATFSPVGEEDDKLAEVLGKLAQFSAEHCDDQMQDAMVAQMAYITGRGYRYCWPEVQPGEPVRDRARVLNPFAVYFDPDSTEVVTRDDAEFLDHVMWMSVSELMREFPDKRASMSRAISDLNNRLLDTSYTDRYSKAADRDHESINYRNGKFKVVERFYRAWKSAWFSIGEDGEPVEVQDDSAFRQMYPGAPLFRKTQDYLYVAIWSPDLMDDDSFLYNGPYHAQPRSASTGKIMWPVIELVSDSIMGESDGFVLPMRDPVKLVAVLATQIVELAKHSGSGYEVDEDAYATPEEAKRAISLGAHANQRYKMKKGRAGDGMKAIQPQQVPPANYQAMQMADAFIYEGTAAPPALQGMSENASTPAALNAQRIEQASTQLRAFIEFNKSYVRRKLQVRYAYWRELFTEEMTFRIVGDDGKSQSYTMNEMVPETDQYGFETGEIAKVNDISSAVFDVVIVDSYASPTYRMRQQQVIGNMLQNAAIASSPTIAPALVDWSFRLSDAPVALKEEVHAQTQAMHAQAQQAQAQGQGQSQSLPVDEQAAMGIMESVNV